MGAAEMSVINRMLQDLEKRQAKNPVDGALSNQVRVPVPRERETAIPWGWLVIGLLSAGCLALGYLYWQQIRQAPGLASRQPLAKPEIPPPMLKPETSLAAREAPHVEAPSKPETVSPAKPAAVPSMNASRSSDASLAKPGQSAAARTTPSSLPQETKQTPAAPPSPPAPVLNTEEIKNIKQVTPEQMADNNYHRALALLQQGRIAEAQALLESVLKQDPKHIGARQALLGIMVENRQTASAIQLLQAGLAVDPSRVEYAMALARLQVAGNDNGAALATMQKYLPQGAGRADYQGFLALLLERADHHKEAAQHYQEALRMSPDTAQWWLGLGISLQASGNPQGAFQAYSRAKQLGTLSPDLQAFIEQRMKQVQQ
jgi:MSHA biogenesis protein MshN